MKQQQFQFLSDSSMNVGSLDRWDNFELDFLLNKNCNASYFSRLFRSGIFEAVVISLDV